jgi:hypothetical protein
MAKLARERAVKERRELKAARREERKQARLAEAAAETDSPDAAPATG